MLMKPHECVFKRITGSKGKKVYETNLEQCQICTKVKKMKKQKPITTLKELEEKQSRLKGCRPITREEYGIKKQKELLKSVLKLIDNLPYLDTDGNVIAFVDELREKIIGNHNPHSLDESHVGNLKSHESFEEVNGDNERGVVTSLSGDTTNEQSECSFINCDNPASICFTCHGEECSSRFESWKEDFIKENKCKESTKNELRKKLDKIVPFAELDKERWSELLNEVENTLDIKSELTFNIKDIRTARRCMNFLRINCENRHCLNESCPLHVIYDSIQNKGVKND